MNLLSEEFKNELTNLIDALVSEKIKNLSLPITEEKSKNAPELDGYLSKRKVCSYYGISISNLNNKLKAGVLKKKHFGGRVLIKKTELDKVLKD